jgi:hypothetical protein
MALGPCFSCGDAKSLKTKICVSKRWHQMWWCRRLVNGGINCSGAEGLRTKICVDKQWHQLDIVKATMRHAVYGSDYGHMVIWDVEAYECMWHCVDICIVL